MFRITRTSGFQITFDNGYTVSVQFGPGNYCDNRSLSLSWPAGGGEPVECVNAEVAVFAADGEWYRPACFGEMNEDVQGWVRPDQIPALLTEVAAL